VSAVVLFLISKDISSAKLFKISEAVECIFSNETLWVVDRFFVDEFATVFIEVVGDRTLFYRHHRSRHFCFECCKKLFQIKKNKFSY